MLSISRCLAVPLVQIADVPVDHEVIVFHMDFKLLGETQSVGNERPYSNNNLTGSETSGNAPGLIVSPDRCVEISWYVAPLGFRRTSTQRSIRLTIQYSFTPAVAYSSDFSPES